MNSSAPAMNSVFTKLHKTKSLVNLLTLLCFLVCFSFQGVGQAIKWVHHIKGSLNDHPVKMVQDKHGNIYYCGYTGGTSNKVSFPDTTIATGSDTITPYIVKIDSNGTFIKKVHVNKGGRWSGELVYDKKTDHLYWGVTNNSGTDLVYNGRKLTVVSGSWRYYHVLKIDTGLNYVKHRTLQLGTSSWGHDHFLAVDTNSNLFLAGHHRNGYKHGINWVQQNNWKYKIYMFKWDKDLQGITRKDLFMTDTFNYQCTAIETDTIGGLFMTLNTNVGGISLNGKSANITRGTALRENAFLAYFDNNLNAKSVTNLTDGACKFNSLNYKKGVLYLGGYFRQRWNLYGNSFGNSFTPINYKKALVLSFNILNNGTTTASRAWNPIAHEALGVAATNDKHLYIVCNAEETWPFNGVVYSKILGHNGRRDIRITKLDVRVEVNHWQWTRDYTALLGGPNIEEAWQVYHNNGRNYILGRISKQSSLTPHLHIPTHGNDIFVGRLSDCKVQVKSNFTTSQLKMCSGDTSILTGPPGKDLIYNWYRNNYLLQEKGKKLPVVQDGSYHLVVNDRGCLDTSTVTKISVDTLPKTKFNPIPSICTNDTTHLLNYALPKGGIYKGLGVVNDSIFKRTISGFGIFPITYVYTSPNGCVDSSTQTIQVSGTRVGINPMPGFCANDKAYTLSQGYPNGGYYSGIGVNGNIFNPSVSGPGNHQLRYIINSGYCSDTAFATIQVDSLPYVSLSTLNPLCESQFSHTLTNGSPSGGIYFGNSVIGSTFYPLIAKAGKHTYGYTVTNSSGCSDTAFSTIKIDNSDTIKINPIPNLCSNSQPVSLSASPNGGYFTIDGLKDSIANPKALTVGSHTAKYHLASSCYVDSSEAHFTIFQKPNTRLIIDSTYCSNESDIHLSGGTPLSGNYYVDKKLDSVLRINALSIGPHTLEYVYRDSNLCSDTSIVQFKIYAKPKVTLDSLPFQCSSYDTLILKQGRPVGGNYKGNNVSGNYFFPKLHGTGKSVITYTYTNSKGCKDSASSQVEVDSIFSIGHQSIDTLCYSSDSIVLKGGIPQGGNYYGTSIYNNKFLPWLSTSGAKSAFYTLNTSCGSDTIPISFYVRPKQTLNFAPIPSICENSDSVQLNHALPKGGVYSGNGIINQKLLPKGLVGTQTVKYTYTDLHGCTDSIGSTLKIDTVPVLLVSNKPSFCDNDSTVNLSWAKPSGGTYSGWLVSNNKIIPGQMAAGTYSQSYTFTDGNGCSDSIKNDIRIVAAPQVSLSSNLKSAYCQNENSVVLAGGNPSGGKFFVNWNTATSFDPSAISAKSNLISYIYTDSNNCNDTATYKVLVNNLPHVNLSSIGQLCSNTPGRLLSIGNPAGGKYSGNGIISGMIYPNLLTPGNHDLYYLYTDSNSCTNSDTLKYKVDTVPKVSFTKWIQLCQNSDTLRLTGGTPLGGTYHGSGIDSNILNPRKLGYGSLPVHYVYTDLNGCSDSVLNYVKIDSLTPLSFSNLPSKICENTPKLPLNFASPIGGVYTGKGVVSGMFNSSSLHPSTILNYRFTNKNGCTDSIQTVIFIDSVTPISYSIPSRICENADSLLLPVPIPAGGYYSGNQISSYRFSPNGLRDSSVITYHYRNWYGCEDSLPKTILIDSIPALTLTLDSIACLNADSIQLNGGNPVGGFFKGPSVANNKLFTKIGLGKYEIKYIYQDNLTKCIDSIADSVQIVPFPNVLLGNKYQLCEGAAPLLLTGGTPIGGNYHGPGVNAGYFLPKSVSPGKYKISYSYTDSLGCKDSSMNYINYDTIPKVSLKLPDSICKNGIPINLNGLPKGGSYKGKGILLGNFDPSIVAGSKDTVWYKFVDANNCMDSVSNVITIDSVPIVSFSAPPGICENNPPVVLNSGLPNGGKFISPFVDTLNGSFDPAKSQVGRHKVSYVFTDHRGCSDSAQAVQEVWSLPSFSLGNDTSFCGNQELVIHSGIDSVSNLWNDSTNNKTLRIKTGGIYWLVVTDSNGCSNSDTIVVSYEAICVGIKDNTNNGFAINYYPNPSNGKLYFDLTGFPFQQAVLKVLNTTGQTIKIIDLENINVDFQLLLDLSTYGTGIYFLELSSHDIRVVNRVVLNY